MSNWWDIFQNPIVATVIVSTILPWFLYVVTSEWRDRRRRKEAKEEAHRKEMRAEAQSKLEMVYGPVLYALSAAANEPARNSVSHYKDCIILSSEEIDELDSILMANNHLVSDEIIKLWRKRNQNAQSVQWNKNWGIPNALNVPVVGYSCVLQGLLEQVNSEYLVLKKQYEENAAKSE